MNNAKANLSVNINKIALLRNSRGGTLPDLYQFARDCEAYGADGITVHPRSDERHIRYADVPILKDVVSTEYNIEGYPSESFLNLVHQIKPHQCTLVPDDPKQLTSDHGWDTVKDGAWLKDIIAELHHDDIRVGIFLDPDIHMCDSAMATGADRIELYTGPYAEMYPQNPQEAIRLYIETAKYAESIGLGINAGHDLNLHNLEFFRKHIPSLMEVSIGHALIADALYFGIQNTIQMYQNCLKVEE